ncbi:MAG: hypothetical protein KDE19_11900 [Caldilineaceae bacterium]|nr:hypothetical protein [Caldilineaceae bacterium]
MKKLLILLTPLIILVLLFLLPPERTLGDVIKLVLLHGALVRAALIGFAIAGLLGLLCLFSKRAVWQRWCVAVQGVSLLLWMGNMLSSSFATRLTWGEWIAWGEPRVVATINILWLAMACLALVLWLNHRIFTGLANLVVAGFSWGLIRGATLVRHPFDPLGTSNSNTYQLLYGGMVVVMLILGWQLARWCVRHEVFAS